MGRSWTQWSGLRLVPDDVELEVPTGEISERERMLMDLDGWESRERMGHTIWRHPEHTHGFWTSADVAVVWAREVGDWPELAE